MPIKKLSELEAELNTDLFFRANRQYIIGLNFIKGFKPFEKVKLQAVDLTVSDALVIISQETAPAFPQMDERSMTYFLIKNAPGRIIVYICVIILLPPTLYV